MRGNYAYAPTETEQDEVQFFDEIEEADFESGINDEAEDFEMEFDGSREAAGPIDPALIHPQLGIGTRVSSELEYEDEEEGELIGSSDSRTPIRNTLKIPYRFICRLTMTYQDPAVFGGAAVMFSGTGTLIGPRHILTAAHNVRNTFDGKLLTAKNVTASPGQDRSSKPFGTVKVSGFKGKNEWMNDQNACHDYALLTLEKDIASQKFKSLGNKPLGHWGDFEKGNDTRLEFVDPAKLKKSKLWVVGYAGDKCEYLAIEKYKKGGVCTYSATGAESKQLRKCLDAGLRASAQFGAKGKMIDPLPPGGGSHLFIYDADTCKGHSGSPVWTENGGLRYLLGVHTGPWNTAKGKCSDVLPAGSRVDANRAVRVTTGMLDNIRKWKA